MNRRRNHQGKKSYWFILLLLVVAGYFLLTYIGFYAESDMQSLVKNSILQGRTFETKVEEVVSPKYKIKAYLFEDKSNPIISLSFLFKNAGWAADDAGKEGIANLAADLMTSGAGKLDAEAFHEELENLAIGLGYEARMDDFAGSLLTTKENSRRAYELLKLTLTEPRFDSEDLERSKAQMLTALKLQQERPESLQRLAFSAEIYGSHPYGKNPLGDKNAIAKANSEMLREFLQQRLARSNLVVAAAGDISGDELGELLDEVFGSLPENGKLNFVRDAEPDFNGRVKRISKEMAQDLSNFAVPGVERNNPDFYPLYVANYIFGGSGLNSRWNVAAREKEGLTYGTYTGLSLADKSALLVGGFSSTPENFAKINQILEQQWAEFANKGATEQEVAEAKEYLIASYNLRFAAISGIADILVAMQRENLGQDFLQKRNDYVRAVTTEQVRAAAKKYFDASKMVFVNMGNFENKNRE